MNSEDKAAIDEMQKLADIYGVINKQVQAAILRVIAIAMRAVEPELPTIDPGEGWELLFNPVRQEGDEWYDREKNTWTPQRLNLGTRPTEIRYRRRKPVESPDDWVTQDRVPARKGDQVRWSNWTGKDRWYEVWEDSYRKYEARHGWVDPADGLTLSVRCLRKDLPPVSPPPKTRTVTLAQWIVWDDIGRECRVFCVGRPRGWKYAYDTGESEQHEVPL